MLGLVAACLAGIGAAPARAQGGTSRVDHLVEPQSRWSLDLGSVVIDLDGRERVARELRSQRRVAQVAAGEEAAAAAGLERSELDMARGGAARDRARTAESDASHRLDQHRRDLVAFAVATYVTGRSGEVAVGAGYAAADPTPTLVDHVGSQLLRARDVARSRHAHAVEALRSSEVELQRSQAERDGFAAQRDRSRSERVAAEATVAALVGELEHGLWSATVSGTELLLVALDAYATAARRSAVTSPGCGIAWYQLAAIGQVESRHGTAGGNRLGPDGRTSGRIVGRALDGHGVAAIADTDGGRLDGDPTWDRAVGPMQFIPGTWASMGADGDGDGSADPHDLHDAAYAAARLLCRSRTTLGDPERYRQALLAYNRSDAYGRAVMAAADRYRLAVAVPAPQ